MKRLLALLCLLLFLTSCNSNKPNVSISNKANISNSGIEKQFVQSEFSTVENWTGFKSSGNSYYTDYYSYTPYVIREGEDIYYAVSGDGSNIYETEGFDLYTVKIDGTQKHKLLEGIKDFFVYDGIVYYTRYVEDMCQEHDEYDVKARKEISYVYPILDLVTDDFTESIYFIDNYNVIVLGCFNRYLSRVDLKNQRLLSQIADVDDFSIEGNRVNYFSSSGKNYSCDLDLSVDSVEEITSTDDTDFHEIGDYKYSFNADTLKITNKNTENAIYNYSNIRTYFRKEDSLFLESDIGMDRIDFLSGTPQSKSIYRFKGITYMEIIDDWIFFIYDDYENLCRVKIDGSCLLKMS